MSYHNDPYRVDYLKIYPCLKERPDVLEVLKKSDRKMKYMEVDLKSESVFPPDDMPESPFLLSLFLRSHKVLYRICGTGPALSYDKYADKNLIMRNYASASS